MTLDRHDTVSIGGLLAHNPATGKPIPGLLQCFAITEPVTGDIIPPGALFPRIGGGYPDVKEPIRMSRVVMKNWWWIH